MNTETRFICSTVGCTTLDQDSRAWQSKHLCRACGNERRRIYPTKKNHLERELQGQLIEDWVSGVSNKELSDKYLVIPEYVIYLTNLYRGVNELPVTFSFIPVEADRNLGVDIPVVEGERKENDFIKLSTWMESTANSLFKVEDRVRILDKSSAWFGYTRPVMAVYANKGNFYYRLKNIHHVKFSQEHLEACTTHLKNIVSFNI